MAKVLLVEDDNNLREIFEMRLQAEGYQTVTAGNGEEGLTVAMKERPDLIIADVMMPKLSGFEMLENLKAAPEMKDTKVIMMTALGQAEDRARGEGLGVVKYLVKSQATLEDFAKVVKDVLPPETKGSSTPAADSKDSSQNNQQESEKTMPPEDTTPTNPTPPADGPTPADVPATPPAVNPVAGDPTADGGQQSTAQEQNTVQNQIDDFVSSAPTGAPTVPSAPAGDSGALGSSGLGTSSPAPDAPVDPTSPAPLSDPSADTSGDPTMPPATPPADNPPAAPNSTI